MIRTVFLIDGFNLYHSLREASYDLGGATTKWLNIRALCESYLYLIDPTARCTDVFYFSALATHLEATKPQVTQRHQSFIQCLKATGVQVLLGRFKPTTAFCPRCQMPVVRYEEKETDVAISVKLLDLCLTDACDSIVLVTGDTDIAPAVRTVQQLCPHKDVRFAFPYHRKNKELNKLAPQSFTIRKEQYTKHQFADPYQLPDGKYIRKPARW